MVPSSAATAAATNHWDTSKLVSNCLINRPYASVRPVSAQQIARYQSRGIQADMQHPFLNNNELVLVDYMPGSSGQLFMRLWSELDVKMTYDKDEILRPSRIANHPCTREVEYDIGLPKTIHNWFIDRCQPTSIDEYAQYFEFIGTALIALKQRWHKSKNSTMFYNDESYSMTGYRVLHGIHTWDKILPIADLVNLGYGIRMIRIVPATMRGLRYQIVRNYLCYPGSTNVSRKNAEAFNSKPSAHCMDLCTLLVDRDTSAILDWFKKTLGSDYRHDKSKRAAKILEVYYDNIVDSMRDHAL